jgi:hypothetical protein
MRRYLAISCIVLGVAWTFSPATLAQSVPGSTAPGSKTAAPPAGPVDVWGRPLPKSLKGVKSAPAPKREITGIWAPTGVDQYGYEGGTQAYGAWSMPSDGKPEHEPPYTPAGIAAMELNKPGFGVREVPAAQANDPVNNCEPRGMPRQDLYELGTIQFLQTPGQTVVLYTRDAVWRVIWTDGRVLPKNAEARWNGYSAGKWEDDTTFVVETNGTDERTWIDNAGRPHSSELRVEERFHRIDHDRMEMTVIIDDPKFYTKPWVAMNKLPFELRPADSSMGEQRCSPAERDFYNKMIADPVGK